MIGKATLILAPQELNKAIGFYLTKCILQNPVRVTDITWDANKRNFVISITDEERISEIFDLAEEE